MNYYRLFGLHLACPLPLGNTTTMYRKSITKNLCREAVYGTCNRLCIAGVQKLRVCIEFHFRFDTYRSFFSISIQWIENSIFCMTVASLRGTNWKITKCSIENVYYIILVNQILEKTVKSKRNISVKKILMLHKRTENQNKLCKAK
jgi:hypothetical protein